MLIDVFQPLWEMGAKIKVLVSNRLVLAQAHQFEHARVLFAFCFCYVMWLYYICDKKDATAHILDVSYELGKFSSQKLAIKFHIESSGEI